MELLETLNNRARAEQLPLDIVVRDLLQSRFLSALFATTMKRDIALKGGMAMRAAYGTPRYTKDIDLQTGPEVSMARIRGLIEGALAKAVDIGLLSSWETSAPKQTETVQRFKVNGTIAGGGSHLNMTIEISRRGMPDDSMLSTIAYAPTGEGELKAVFVESYAPSAMAASKVDALLSPNRIAVRDVLDLYRLAIEMRIDPPTHILKKLGKDALAQGMVELWPKLELMTWEYFVEDMLPHLPKEMADKIDEIEWDNMRMRTEAAVRNWLELAYEEAESQSMCNV